MTDAFICDYIRTPIGRYGGALAPLRTDDLAALPLAALLARNPDLDPAAVEEVWLGCANQAGEDNRNVARMALLLAGLPETVPGVTVNRLCGSGLEAVAAAARAIRSGDMDLAIAGGVESMTRAPFVMSKAPGAWSRANEIHDTTIGWRFVNPRMQAQYGTDSMPETAQNLADDHAISREDQDAFALRSQQKAGAAQANGRLAQEILPVTVALGRGKTTEVTRDEHPRATMLEDLARLKPITRPEGSVTAGNASGVNDGAAALIVASEMAVKRHGLRPLARIVAGASAGVAPRVMGYGPVPAVQKLLEKAGIGLDALALIELNEAFAAQALAVISSLGLADDDPRVNPNGGAIALGHPLGMSGARIAGSAALDLSQGTGRYALATMCIGVGQGAALLLERV
ncbi:3-oxoadipyl-CoA thiolase [Paracoccus versutus]|uniref:Beta-ketoadipyl-CoA thiolase n=1 Tax=Paracoccus versutus TaxID=34007 RepID=A0AAQ0KKM0_PARVE|nr:3-oxoadipyl-CoA thiolase [Paracoccus versutus]KGJ10041.1 beta-ketoadipyl CoA thiolase [Paracoccus versutus]REG39480.1 acetyl-CoA acyltransferase/3-oxo-5,6-didehydrosuberyl-CoA/3-oxoadipyl-CoA thiolase [Paracoccus versutus]WEJ77515.1 3-oxoadipyl-CoA thiolase [Paracoccus versutus]